MADFKSGFTPRPTKVPKQGGSGNALMNMMLAQSMLGEKTTTQGEAENKVIAGAQGQLGSQMRSVQEQFPGGRAPLESKMKYGDTTIELNPKYTVDEARSLGMSDSITRGIGYLLEKQKTDPNFRKNFQTATIRVANPNPGNVGPISTTIGNKDAGIMKDYLKDLSDRILRLRSGAQINEQEMKRMTGLLPTWEDVSDNDPSYERMNRKLSTFTREMNDLKQRVVNGRMLDDRGIGVAYDPNIWQEPIDKMVSIQTTQPQQGQQQTGSQDGRIKVRSLATGKTGTISAANFNDQKYARI